MRCSMKSLLDIIFRWTLALAISAGCYSGPSPELTDKVSIKQPRASAVVNLSDEKLAERARLAASRRYLAPKVQIAAPLAATAWSDALDIPSAYVVDTTLSGPSAAAQIRTGLGVIQPVRGGSFVLLSTGIAGAGTA